MNFISGCPNMTANGWVYVKYLITKQNNHE